VRRSLIVGPPEVTGERRRGFLQNAAEEASSFVAQPRSLLAGTDDLSVVGAAAAG